MSFHSASQINRKGAAELPVDSAASTSGQEWIPIACAVPIAAAEVLKKSRRLVLMGSAFHSVGWFSKGRSPESGRPRVGSLIDK
jgi:hypothetical protein